MALRRWAFRARAALARHRGGIDALNVFPVPDGDTGTNMLATLTGALRGAFPGGATAVDATGDAGPQPEGDARGGPSRLEDVARTSVTSARGNSGAILGELLRGLSQVAGGGRSGIDGPTLAAALRTASERDWQAVGRPVDGTMLSVARAAAAAADQAARGGGRLVDVTAAAVEGARAGLASTPEQLPTLRRAGVVDAGGAGLLVVLTALHDVVTGGRTREHLPSGAQGDQLAAGISADSSGSGGSGESGGSGPACASGVVPDAGEVDPPEGMVEVMYVVTGADPAARTRLRDELDALGDSVVVAGDLHGASVHVHTTRADDAIASGRIAGEVRDVRIEPLVPVLTRGPDPAQVEPPQAGEERPVPGEQPVLLGHRLSADLDVPLPGLAVGGSDDDANRRASSGVMILVTDRSDDPSDAGAPESLDGAKLPHVLRCESLPAALAALAVYDTSAGSSGPADGTDRAMIDGTVIDSAVIDRTVRAMRAAADAVTTVTLPRDPAAGGEGGDDESDDAGPRVDERLRDRFARRVEAAIEAGGELVTIVAGPDGTAVATALESALAAASPGGELEIARFTAAAPLPDALVVVGVE